MGKERREMDGAAMEEKAVKSNDEETFKVGIFLNKENELECIRAKMMEAREENQRLKRSLNQITKDYQTLQMQYNDIVTQEASNVIKTNNPTTQSQTYQEAQEPDHFVSLSLGRTSSTNEQLLKNEVEIDENKRSGKEKESLSLGLEYKYESPNEVLAKTSPGNSGDLGKEENEDREVAMKSGGSLKYEHNEVSQQNPTKRARVSVRVRCDTPTMNDGCQWRKYGQKIAKGNPCPRAYYRCTVAPSCPVRKQVQRCAQDMSVLIITYEGTHNHPLSVSATEMASATSSAAAMLLSGSSASSSNIHDLNFNPSDLSKSKQFYIPNNPNTSSTNPTITLDLTSSSSSSIFNKFSSNYLSTPNYSSANLSFNPLESNPLPLSWGGTHSYFKKQVGNSLNFGGQYSTHEQSIYKPLIQNPNPNSLKQSLAPEDVAAATKAITSDPKFQSALVTALSSIIGNRGNGEEAFGNGKNIAEAYPGVSNLPPTSTQKGYNFSSSYLGINPRETSTRQGSLVSRQPSLQFDSTPKSKSSSPSDEGRSL